MIVSSAVVKAGILPNPKLFFGFEELEFCLRVKDAGFSILIDGLGILEERRRSGNLEANFRWKGKSMGVGCVVNRQYYSLRNMLFILWSRGEYIGYIFLLSKTFVKILVSPRYGFRYFREFSALQINAVFHHLKGRYGYYLSTNRDH
jgi:GT2 family glycosyltransferase